MTSCYCCGRDYPLPIETEGRGVSFRCSIANSFREGCCFAAAARSYEVPSLQPDFQFAHQESRNELIGSGHCQNSRFYGHLPRKSIDLSSSRCALAFWPKLRIPLDPPMLIALDLSDLHIKHQANDRPTFSVDRGHGILKQGVAIRGVLSLDHHSNAAEVLNTGEDSGGTSFPLRRCSQYREVDSRFGEAVSHAQSDVRS